MRYRRWIAGAAILPIAVLLVLAGLVAWPGEAVPGFNEVRADWRPSEAYLLDRHGRVLDTKRINFQVRRLDWEALGDVSPALIKAIIAGEDKRFRQHAGVDWLAFATASWGNITGAPVRGASTITMQLAAFIRPELKGPGRRSLIQKFHQIRLARGIERKWTKDQILEAYFNLLDYRGELQGIAAATELMAGKKPAGLTLAESYVLAALLPSPSADARRIAARACARYPGMDCGVLAQTSQTMLTRVRSGQFTPRLAPHLAASLLSKPGERLQISLDADVQQVASTVLTRHLAGLADRNVRDGAVLVADNETGEVLAYVASAGPASRAPHVDGIRALRQAGSTLKPFLYGLTFEKRYLTPASLLADSPLNLDTASGLYIPQNYDHTFHGPVSIRTALGSSLNIPAVRTLVLLGVEAFRDGLNAIGYTSIDQEGDYYGYSLALGSAEVTLWEQVTAYSTIARGGTLVPLTLKPDQPRAAPRQVWSTEVAYLVASILSDRAARVTTFGLSNNLNTRFWSAVKTGTSKDMRDNWSIGFSPRFTVGVWVGNFEGDSMRNVSGVSGAAPVWQEIMTLLHERGAAEPPAPPDGVVAMRIAFAPAVEAPRDEWFLNGTELAIVEQTDAEEPFSRITSPANGMVVAIDPDIPLDRQRIPIEAAAHDSSLVLKVGKITLGPAGVRYMWPPLVGAHAVTLAHADGTVVDRSKFQVRKVPLQAKNVSDSMVP
ncbi:MAG: penicillin-binding protein 1C [Alphaproteobacteria bacterium]